MLYFQIAYLPDEFPWIRSPNLSDRLSIFSNTTNTRNVSVTNINIKFLFRLKFTMQQNKVAKKAATHEERENVNIVKIDKIAQNTNLAIGFSIKINEKINDINALKNLEFENLNTNEKFSIEKIKDEIETEIVYQRQTEIVYKYYDDLAEKYKINDILNKEYTQEAANTDNTKTEKSKK